LKEKFGVIIESDQVADAFRKLFTLALEKADDYDKEISARLKSDEVEAKKKKGKKK